MRKKSFLLLLPILLGACEKELDFKYHDVESQPIIEGVITEDFSRVTITYTTPMNEPLVFSPVTDAVVSITDMTDNITRNLTINEEGIYFDYTSGIPGHEYKLDISQGEKIFSSVSLMRGATDIVNLEFQWIRMPYDYVAVLEVSFIDPETPGDYFWIRIYRNGEPYKWLLSDDRAAVNGMISEVTFTTRKDLDQEDDKDILYDGDEVKVTVASIGRDMFDYLTAISSDSNGPRMFEGDFCLGYFYGGGESTATIIFHPDELTEYK